MERIRAWDNTCLFFSLQKMQCNTVYQLSKIGLSQDEPSCLCVEVMEVGVKWRRGKSVPVFNHGVNPSAADDDRTTRGTWHLVASAWVRVRSRALSPFPWACAPLLTKERELRVGGVCWITEVGSLTILAINRLTGLNNIQLPSCQTPVPDTFDASRSEIHI